MDDHSKTAKCDEIVKAITYFYQILTTIGYLPASATKLRQQEDAVLDVLSHLPYIHDPNYHVAYAIPPIQWNAERVKDGAEDGNKALWEASLDPPNENISPQVVSLTTGTRYGSWFLLDAEEGTIINYSILGEPQLDSDLWSHSDNQIGMGWNLLPRILVKRFFENCIKKYRTLEWVPVLGWNRDGVEIWDASSQDKEALEGLRKVYQDHSWPSANFRKDDFDEKSMMYRPPITRPPPPEIPPVTASTSPSPPSETSIQYCIVTRRGTTMDEFNTFNSLPDAGQGIKIVYDTIDSQVYGTFLTASQLADVRKNSIVDVIERNSSGGEVDGGDH